MLRHASGALRRVAARRQASTLILADHDGANMTPSTLAALTAASKLNETSAVLVAGAPAAVAEQASKAAGVEAVFHVDAPPLLASAHPQVGRPAAEAKQAQPCCVGVGRRPVDAAPLPIQNLGRDRLPAAK